MPDAEVTTVIPVEPQAAAAVVEPAKAEPVKAEPVKAEPVKAEPVKEPAKAEEKTPLGAAEAPKEYKFTAPEGMKLDEAQIGKFTEMAKAANLDPKAAQEMLDLYSQNVQAATAANAKAWTDLQAQWKSELEKDPELGGSKAPAAMAVIGRAMDTYGSKEAREALDLTGAGNNPHIARLVYNMAKALDEGGPVHSGGVPGGNKSLGERFYGGKS